MTWFKVDDKLHDHRKARAAGSTAMGVWLLAGSWSADNLTDGFVPATILARWGRPRDASRLVEVGLWHADEQDGEKGWRFHEWAERQPTRAQKLAEREAKVEAGRIGGLRSGRSRREANTKQSASGLVEPPSRPDPTRPTDAYASVSARPALASEPDVRFEEFWETYDNKKDRRGAEKKWALALKKPGVTADLLISAAAAYVLYEHTSNENGRYIMGPAKWLLNERWRDERKVVAPPMTNTQGWMQLTNEIAEREGDNVRPFRAIGGDR
jgi:hypothetical protein